ncbi:MAG: hypothetical protein JWN71_3212 [Xanthobacteraceae bacterium]|nr:hypothetical protein [Xanthobacteraceae bacterium]
MGTGWTLPNVALATTLIFLFHGLVFGPAAASALRRADVGRVGFWSAVTAIVDASKLVWMMLALSALITWGAIAIVSIMGGETAAAAQSALNRLRDLRSGIIKLEQGGSVLLLALASAALLFWVWRHRTRRIAGVIEQVRVVQAEVLFTKLKEGTLPELEPNETMLRVGGIIGTLKAEQDKVEEAVAKASDDTEKARLMKRRTELASDEERAFQAYVAIDIGRRIEVSPLEALEGDIPRPARTLMERLGRFLISRGLLQRLNWGQRGLLLLNLLLAVPTVLVAAQADVAQRLNAQQFRLAELSIDWTARERAAQLGAATEAAKNDKQADSTPQSSDAQVTQAANHIAHVFERHLGNTYGKLVRSSRSAEHLTPADGELIKAHADMRAAKTRRDILSVLAADRPDSGIYVDPDPIRPTETSTGSVSRPAERVQRIPGLLDSSTNAASALARGEGKPVTSAGRAMARQVQDLMMSSTSARDILLKASASFQEVARPSQVAKILLSEIFSAASRGAPADLMSPEMSEWVNRSVSAPVRDRVNAAMSTTFRATLLETRDLARANAALGQVANTGLATADFSALRPVIEASLPSDAEAAELARSRHPGLRQSLDAKTAATQRDLTKAVYMTARLDLGAEQVSRLEAAVARAGAIQSFEDIVPPTVGAAPPAGDAPSGSPRPGDGSSSGRPSGEARAPVRAASSASVARGRNFASLRGFARVGGVLIGRDPEAGGPPLDFRTFEWTRDGSELRFRLGTATGTTINAGPFHGSAVHAAVAYAADGRPLTVTMISAEPLSDLKILLHPALLDTSLGCRAISIDRFADEATGQDKYPERMRAERSFQADFMLYEIARAAIVDGAIDRIGRDDADYLKQSVVSAHALMDQLKSTGGGDNGNALRSMINVAIKGSDPVSKSASGLHRFDHFSRDVVEIVEACRGPSVNGTDFVNCTRERSKELLLLRGKLMSAAMPVPTFQIWSGVREIPYVPEPGLSFLTQPSRDALQFMVQVAFTSPPYQKIREKGGAIDEASEHTDPYEFGTLKISEKVLELVAASPAKRDVLDGIVEFTALQRFFRLALSGGLGSYFPVEKLTELASDTRADVKPQTTPRWNAADGEFRFLVRVASTLPQMPAALKAKAETCLKANGMQTQIPAGGSALQSVFDAWKRRTPLGSPDWTSACVFPETTALSVLPGGDASMTDLIKFSQQFPAIRDLRRSLGVEAAERSDPETCKPL